MKPLPDTTELSAAEVTSISDDPAKSQTLFQVHARILCDCRLSKIVEGNAAMCVRGGGDGCENDQADSAD